MRLQDFYFLLAQLKHEVFRETLNITFYLLVKTFCFYTIEQSQIPVNNNLLASDYSNHQLYIGSHRYGSFALSSIFSLSLAIPLLLLNFIQVFDNLNAQCVLNPFQFVNGLWRKWEPDKRIGACMVLPWVLFHLTEFFPHIHQSESKQVFSFP